MATDRLLRQCDIYVGFASTSRHNNASFGVARFGCAEVDQSGNISNVTDFPQHSVGFLQLSVLFSVTATMRGGFCCFLSHGDNMRGGA